MNSSTMSRRLLKIVSIIGIIAMCFISFEVVVGLTSFSTYELSAIRLTAFVIVAIFPIIAIVIYIMLGRRPENLGLGLVFVLGALACDLALLLFANGRL